MSSALPSTSYEVAVTPNGTGGAGPGSNQDCVYWDIGTKTTTSFTITQYRCSDGNLRAVDATLVLGWVAIANR